MNHSLTDLVTQSLTHWLNVSNIAQTLAAMKLTTFLQPVIELQWSDWLTHRLTYWLTDWPCVWLSDLMTFWLADCVIQTLANRKPNDFGLIDTHIESLTISCFAEWLYTQISDTWLTDLLINSKGVQMQRSVIAYFMLQLKLFLNSLAEWLTNRLAYWIIVDCLFHWLTTHEEVISWLTHYLPY